MTSTWWRRSRWTVGSSRTSIGRAWATASASSTSCRSPSDSSRASRPSRCPRPTRSIAAAVAPVGGPRAPQRVLVAAAARARRPPRPASRTAAPPAAGRRRGAGRPRPGRALDRAVEEHPAGGRPHQPGRHAQQGRLAGAVRPDERDPLAGDGRRGRRRRTARPRTSTVTSRARGAAHSSYPGASGAGAGRKNGAPMTAVTTPTGMSPSIRATRSA